MTKLKQKIAVGSLIVLALGTVINKKVFDYAAPLQGERDCNYIAPQQRDADKATTIGLQSRPNTTGSQGSIEFAQIGGFITDASCLNKTAIAGVVQVRNEQDIRAALSYASENNVKVSLAGARHSMGGQSFIKNGLVLDMTDFAGVTIDRETKIARIQSGARWEKVQQALDAEDLAVNVMQSYNIFTVGGTLSVNAHGAAHNQGPISATVQSIRVMLADGTVKNASRTENPELFKLALGGYGLFGVILDADIKVVGNEVFVRHIDSLDYQDFAEYYAKQIQSNPNIPLFSARLSMAPHSYLREVAATRYERPSDAIAPPSLNTQPNLRNQTFVRLVLNFSKTGALGRWTRWMAEKYVEPRFRSCLMTRNEAMTQPEACHVVRNQEMYNSVATLNGRLPDTNILQEYFVAPEQMTTFVDGLRQIVRANKANLLNTTIRIVPKDTDSALPYAKQDVFAFVLYFNQRFNDHDSAVLKKTTSDLIDLTTNLGGTFYLPYQLYYSKEQLRAAYPEVDHVFAEKRRLDPQELFVNTFYKKYAGS